MLQAMLALCPRSVQLLKSGREGKAGEGRVAGEFRKGEGGRQRQMGLRKGGR